jgi:POT family proton-dependent oligopeptide transporter
MSNDRLPPQTKFIVGNEACERLSYYGMRSVLVVYIASQLYPGGKDADAFAKSVFHYFIAATYLLPLLGAWIADRFWGRYKTILYISLMYCVGHGLLAACDLAGEMALKRVLFFAGLACIAIGSGGIKPCVSAFAGDQFRGGREHLLPKIYGLFYWSINFGSFFAFIGIPVIKKELGYAWAFGIPGIFMAIATLIFWLGRHTYQHVPPNRHEPPVDAATRTADLATLGRIALVFLPISVFWSLFDQTGSTWILQGQKMEPYPLTWAWDYPVNAETIQAVNALFVMIFIPIFTYWLYPRIARAGVKPTPLRRMGAGMVIGALSFVVSAWLQQRVDAGEHLSILWQLAPYAVLTAGEVLLSATGLEFAFMQAPPRLKSTIMSFWLLTVFLGNFLTGTVTWLNAKLIGGSAPGEMLFYAGLMLVVAGIFAAIARGFPERAPDAAK